MKNFLTINYFVKNKERGFTLLELLVVIAIIGILATTIMINAINSRTRAKDSNVKASLGSFMSSAELNYSETAGYADTCNSSDFAMVKAVMIAQGGSVYCQCNATSFAAWASLSNGFWCVDSLS